MRLYDPMRIYLAGPMSGYPKLNFETFDFYERSLMERGFDVESPARLDGAEFREAVMRGEHDGDDLDPLNPKYSQTWVNSIVRDLEALMECDGVAVLPQWHKSLGARLEVTTAMYYEMPIYSAIELTMPPHPLSNEFVKELLNA